MSCYEQTSLCPVTRSDDEEFANALTHAMGFALTLPGAVVLGMMLRSAEMGLVISCGIYLATLIAVYAVSTLSHAVREERIRYLFRIWDQGLIYGLIAGSYTPFVWVYARPEQRWVLLALIWSAALVGFFTKVILQRRVNGATTTYSYVLLGWVPAMALLHRVPVGCLLWMAASGLFYTAGTLFLKMDNRQRYFHATWHVFVILGSACHYFAVVAFVAMRPAAL